jgi:Mg-chelatase subunit ChlD
MNPDLTHNSREELEAALTALLLGELPPEQASALHRAIEQDAALAALHQRLKLTIDLVRETAAQPADETARPTVLLKLSQGRRQELLAHFKTVAPKEFARPRRPRWNSPVLVAAAAVLVGLLALAVFLPLVSASKRGSSEMASAKSDLVLREDLAPRGGTRSRSLGDRASVTQYAGGAYGGYSTARMKVIPYGSPGWAEAKAEQDKLSAMLAPRPTPAPAPPSFQPQPAPGGAVQGAGVRESPPPALAKRTPIVLPGITGANETAGRTEAPGGRAGTPPPGSSSSTETAQQIAPPGSGGTAVRIFQLSHADPKQLADQISQLFPDTSRTGTGPGFSMRFGGAGFGGGLGDNQAAGKTRDKKASQVIAVPDTHSGSIMVSGPAEIMPNLAEMVATLDAGATQQAVRVNDLANADPQDRQQIMQELFQRSGAVRASDSNNRNSRLGAGNPLFTRMTQNQTSPSNPSPGLDRPPANAANAVGLAGLSTVAPTNFNALGQPVSSFAEIQPQSTPAPGRMGMGGVGSYANGIGGINNGEPLAMTRGGGMGGGMGGGGASVPELSMAPPPAPASPAFASRRYGTRKPGASPTQSSPLAAAAAPVPSLELAGVTQAERRLQPAAPAQAAIASPLENQTQNIRGVGLFDDSSAAPGSSLHDQSQTELRLLLPAPPQATTANSLEQKDQAPALGDAPVVGKLFRNETAESNWQFSTRGSASTAGNPLRYELAEPAQKGASPSTSTNTVLGEFFLAPSNIVLPMTDQLAKSAADGVELNKQLSRDLGLQHSEAESLPAQTQTAKAKKTPQTMERKALAANVSPYPSSTTIGDAYFSIDPESRRVLTFDDGETSQAVSQVLSNLNRQEAATTPEIKLYAAPGANAQPADKLGKSLSSASTGDARLSRERLLVESKEKAAGADRGTATNAPVARFAYVMPSAGDAARELEQTRPGAPAAVRRAVEQQIAEAGGQTAMKRRDLASRNKLGADIETKWAMDGQRESRLQPNPSGRTNMTIEDYGVVFSPAGAAAEPRTEPDQPRPRPAASAPIPQPEVRTRENAFSTFSLNVSDVSFKLAAASLEKGLMPDPATVRSEEFINAFDYRDPEAPPGVPVAFACERARYPFAQNRDLLRFSLKTAAQGRQAGRPLNLVLLLDNSGSMERADRVRIIHEALRVLAAQLGPQDTLSVVTFARTARLWVDGVPGSQAGQVAQEVSGLTPQGGTNLEEALNLAYQTALRHYLANGINRVVLLTDGAANLGNVEPEALKQKVEVHRKQGVALDCFGIGWEGYNDDLLEVLSRNGDGRYGFLNTPEEAATEFAAQLAGALRVAASDVKVQVQFNPARVRAYRQMGYARHQLTKEQFRDNTVAAAQIGAAESGNALYVIEIDPRGDGPLGVVRVRYKVPGTSDYREQEWTVPYTGSAAPFEQTSAALRLAAVAGAFSEWLVSSPFAAEVTPDSLLACLRGVPDVYAPDARPVKLEWMIRQAESLEGK